MHSDVARITQPKPRNIFTYMYIIMYGISGCKGASERKTTVFIRLGLRAMDLREKRRTEGLQVILCLCPTLTHSCRLVGWYILFYFARMNRHCCLLAWTSGLSKLSQKDEECKYYIFLCMYALLSSAALSWTNRQFSTLI